MHSQHSHDPLRIARLNRLLTQNTEGAWRKLAEDVTKKWDGLGPLTWQEALHRVICTLIFPPGPPGKDAVAHYRRLHNKAGRPPHFPLPLFPASMAGANAERNWLALYLKTWIIPVFFGGKHYAEIAELVNCALGLVDEKFEEVNVRKLKSWHFRKSPSVRS